MSTATRSSTLHSYEYIAACSHLPTLPSRFSLTIRQQPIQTRTSTTNERDRRPVDPPPILQIKLEDATLRETQDFLQNPYFFMGASLVRPDSTDNSCIGGLAGQTVSSMYKLKDYDNNDGGFFVFGDLSIRMEGQFRLRFTLFEITTQGAVNLKSIYSDVFTVYSAKTFPGMLESTFLSRTFSDQGVRLRIRKEHRVQMGGSRKRKMSTVHDDNDTVSSENSSIGKLQRSPYHSPPTTSVSWYWPPPQALSHYHPLKPQQQPSQFLFESSSSSSRQPPPPPTGVPPLSATTPTSAITPTSSNSLYYQYLPAPPPQQPPNKAPRRLSMDTSAAAPLAPPQTATTSARRSWSFSVHRNTTPPLDDHRRMSEQDDDMIATPQSSGGIRLPPIRNILNANSKDIGEVDAAVAMMQLASSPQQPPTTQHHYYHHHHQHPHHVHQPSSTATSGSAAPLMIRPPPSQRPPSSRRTQAKKSTVW